MCRHYCVAVDDLHFIVALLSRSIRDTMADSIPYTTGIAEAVAGEEIFNNPSTTKYSLFTFNRQPSIDFFQALVSKAWGFQIVVL